MTYYAAISQIRYDSPPWDRETDEEREERLAAQDERDDADTEERLNES